MMNGGKASCSSQLSPKTGMSPPIMQQKSKLRVVAGKLNKPVKNPNFSFNNSFSSRSSHSKHYLTDLKNNNAKLASALATERNKTAHLFKMYQGAQDVMMNHRLQLRNLARAARTGLQKTQMAFDLLIEASELWGSVTETMQSLTPELESRASQSSTNNELRNLSSIHSGITPLEHNANCNSASENAISQPTPANNESRNHCITPVDGNANNNAASSSTNQQAGSPKTILRESVKPMVKGQIISHPTVALQRVVIPTRPLAKSQVQPSRGVELNLERRGVFTRLSPLQEETSQYLEADVSTSVINSSPSSSTFQDGSSTSPTETINLQMSNAQVVLERIIPNLISSSLNECSGDDEEQQLTTVHFGNFKYSPPRQAPLSSLTQKTRRTSSPQKPPQSAREAPQSSNEAPLASPQQTSQTSPRFYPKFYSFQSLPGQNDKAPRGHIDTNVSTRSKPALNSSNSDDLTESSSDDEELALQIAESKKQFLNHKPSKELKEGTSWNYDNSGKFRKNPPKKRNLEKHKISDPRVYSRSSGRTKSPSKCTEESLSQPNEQLLGVPMQPEDVVVTGSVPCDVSQSLNLLEHTVLDPEDMSFTCATVTRPVIIPYDSKSHEVNQAVKEIESAKEPVNDNRMEETDIRSAYVTQRTRTRSRKDKAEPGESNQCMSSLSSGAINYSHCENNENSPPSHLPHKPSFVVLERLPKDFSHLTHSSSSLCVNAVNDVIVKKKKNPIEPLGSPASSIRKRPFAPTGNLDVLYSDDDNSSVEELPPPRRKPGPKRKTKVKERRKYLEPKETSNTTPRNSSESMSGSFCPAFASSPTCSSHVSSRNSSLAESEDSHDICSRRPRRNAAPTNMKEPKLKGKLRRP